MRTALSPVILTSPVPTGLYHSQRSPLSVTTVLVQPASLEELGLEAEGLVQQTVMDADAVDLVAVHHGVGEPVEQILDGQQGHPLVGCGVPSLPGLPFLRWHDALRFSDLEVSVVLHYDDPGLVPGLQYGLQHEEIVAVGVDREEIECFLDFKPLEDLHYVVWPEDDFLQPDVRVLVTSVQQERLSYVPTFLLSGMDNSIKATRVLSNPAY